MTTHALSLITVAMKDTSILTLRPFGTADFDPLSKWFADERSLVQWGGPEVRHPLDHMQLEMMLREAVGSNPRRWLFSGEVGGILMGHTQVALDWHQGLARLSRIAVAPSFRGLGLARPFLQAVLDDILAIPGFERIELNVFTFNEPAMRLYRSLGFVEEGVRRRAVKVGSDRWDTAIYGLLRDDV